MDPDVSITHEMSLGVRRNEAIPLSLSQQMVMSVLVVEEAVHHVCFDARPRCIVIITAITVLLLLLVIASTIVVQSSHGNININIGSSRSAIATATTSVSI
jgi:hypothetical protein